MSKHRANGPPGHRQPNLTGGELIVVTMTPEAAVAAMRAINRGESRLWAMAEERGKHGEADREACDWLRWLASRINSGKVSQPW